MVVFSNEVCSTFIAMSSCTLLSDHVFFGIRVIDGALEIIPLWQVVIV